MEIGWYLRLSRARELEFLVPPSARPTLDEQRMTVSGWQLCIEAEAGFLRARYTRLATTHPAPTEGVLEPSNRS